MVVWWWMVAADAVPTFVVGGAVSDICKSMRATFQCVPLMPLMFAFVCLCLCLRIAKRRESAEVVARWSRGGWFLNWKPYSYRFWADAVATCVEGGEVPDIC